MDDKEVSKEEGPRAFSRFLELVADGEAHMALSSDMHDLMTKMREHAAAFGGSVGRMTLSLAFAVDHNGVLDVSYDVSVVEPKKKRSKSVMWLTKGNNITAVNPKQQKLELRDVKAPEMRTDGDSNTGTSRG